MFVAIDYKAKRFLPIKHDSMHVVGDLVWVEAPTLHVHVESATWPFLTTWGDLDMVQLYKNTTGQTATKVGDNLRAILLELAERIPERKINAFELSKQADLVPERCSMRYLYAPGQFKPAEQAKDFVLQPVTLPKAEDENAVCARPRVRPVARAPVAPATTPAANRSAGPVRAPSAPRQHGVRELVWGVADKLWQAAGSPKEMGTVLKLRKEMMSTLEAEHGVKRTTSSNELGAWQKARI
jgi:hypothetical protein